MTPAEPYAEMLAAFHMLRAIGVLAVDIYAHWNGGQAIMLVRQNGRDFNILCGESQDTDEGFRKNWLAAVAWWQDPKNVDARLAVWQASRSVQNSMLVWQALLDRGFIVRGHRDWGEG